MITKIALVSGEILTFLTETVGSLSFGNIESGFNGISRLNPNEFRLAYSRRVHGFGISGRFGGYSPKY